MIVMGLLSQYAVGWKGCGASLAALGAVDVPAVRGLNYWGNQDLDAERGGNRVLVSSSGRGRDVRAVPSFQWAAIVWGPMFGDIR